MSTVPHASVPRLPVRTIRVEVIEGVDRGAHASGDRLAIGTAEGNDLRLTDARVSRFHVELGAAGASVRVRDLGSTNGTRVGAVTIERGEIALGASNLGASLEIGATKIRITDAELTSVETAEEPRFGPLLGRSAVMRRLMARLDKVAASETSVLLVGESGTGKELAAQAIHERSARAKEPFVVVDCGAIAPTLVASELFGHERGSFTGAERTSHGAFERAARGTLFIDEVGELPLALQTTLLGVLERKRYRRVGGDRDLVSEARVIAATNRDLRAEVNAGRFRLDLYYRLAVVTLDLPPLRDRSEDLRLLVEHFLRELGSSAEVEDVFDADAIAELERHAFPGNVRELKNLVEATLTLGEAPSLASRPSTSPSLPDDVTDARLDLPFRDAKREIVDAFERRYLTRWLDRTGGNVAKVARESGLDRSYVTDLVRKHGLR
ncbi:MAG: sigma 54-dependent Fis family transcriptional regulator [Deltaproteobacteria bacterium]|nr:sigma 54-dependent Fis family transcriptional regulator [Deltaproteobacteria bacterium]